MIKAVLLDFDGTLVYRDILDVICGIVGKAKESYKINNDFLTGKLPGLTALITRINFLQGLSLFQIEKQLDQDTYLTTGAKELIDFLNQQKIIIILYSGNITPILSYYQKLLGINYIVGSQPKMEGQKIIGISKEDFPGKEFKLLGVKKILHKLSILKEETLAIGDSSADKSMFKFAGKSVAINPKNGIEKFTDFVIDNNLSKTIPIIKKLNKIY